MGREFDGAGFDGGGFKEGLMGMVSSMVSCCE